jgi:hypothetical protein
VAARRWSAGCARRVSRSRRRPARHSVSGAIEGRPWSTGLRERSVGFPPQSGARPVPGHVSLDRLSGPAQVVRRSGVKPKPTRSRRTCHDHVPYPRRRLRPHARGPRAARCAQAAARTAGQPALARGSLGAAQHRRGVRAHDEEQDAQLPRRARQPARGRGRAAHRRAARLPRSRGHRGVPGADRPVAAMLWRLTH